jgi:sensor histidine kinase regulating citrate/malate metabolism
VVIEIEDEGRGMTREFIHDSLFAPARSTKSRGHGIGAYQARELIRAAGGDIQVTSEVGVGTRVNIILPDAKARADHSQLRRIAG